MRKLFVLFLMLLITPALADLTVGKWSVSRQIILPKMKSAGPVYLPLDDHALAADSLSEYRIVHEEKEETPYRMLTEEGQIEKESIPAKTLFQGTLKEATAQIIIDLGAAALLGDKLRLQLKGDNFRSKVTVEASRDQKQWWRLTDKAVVYRHEGKFEQTSVDLPSNNARFLRITLAKIQGTLPQIEAVQIERQLKTPRLLMVVPATLSRLENAKRHETILDLTLKRPARDLVQADFMIENPLFDRPLTIESTVSEKELPQGAGAGRLRRVAPGAAVTLPLQLPRALLVRFTLTNGDDKPLRIQKITLWRVRRGLVFNAEPEGHYALWYGRADAPQPEYDLARLPLPSPPANLPRAGLGQEEKMALAPPSPPPWSESHPAIFWVILLLVIVLLALLVIRMMKTAKSAPPAK